MKKILLLLILIVLAGTATVAQELRCRVQINSDLIQGTSKDVFTDLESQLTEFLNNRKWSDTTFSGVEKIDCSFFLTIKEFKDDQNYTCELQVQARRPVYNSSYLTTLFNHRDLDVIFTHRRGEPISYNEHTIESNLVAVTSFYSYIVLGIDFDSYQLYGGESFYKQAQNIAALAQGSNTPGWQALDNNRSRYNFISSLLDPAQKPFRQMMYEYHRLGFDEMALSIVKGRTALVKSLSLLEEIYESRPTSILLISFSDSKLDELNELFGDSKAPAEEKAAVIKILQRLYPAQRSRYQAILDSPN